MMQAKFPVAGRSLHWVLLFLVSLFGCSHPEDELPPLPSRLIRFSDKFFDVAALGPERAVVVGYAGKILLTDDGGFTWRQAESGTDLALYRVCFVDSQRGWVSGQQGMVLQTDDGGQSWRRVRTPTRANLFSLAFVDAEYGWAVGELSLGIRTQDGGKSWSLHKIPTREEAERSAEEALVQQDPILYDVWFADRKRGWVAGEFGKLLRTTDGGVTWSSHERSLLGEEIVDVYDIPTFFGLAQGPDGLLVAVGLEGRIVRSVDGGQTWSIERVEAPFPVVDPLFVPVLLPNGNGWAAGASGQVLFFQAGSSAWTPARLDMGVATWIRGMAWWDAEIGWLVGGYGLILHTRDGGRTWTPAIG